MLRFDAWPPEPHKIAWAAHVRTQLYEAPIHVRARTRLREGEQQLVVIGSYVGSLLAENVVATSGRDADFWVQRIAVELTQGWHPEARTTFMQAVVLGADINSQYAEYRTPLEPVSVSEER